MFKPGGLTPKQNTFVANYISNGNNATQAAKDAGYSQPNMQGARLIAKDSIQEVIAEKLHQKEKATLVDLDNLIAAAFEIRERCRQGEPVLNSAGYETGEWKFDSNGALKANEQLAKFTGNWVDKSENKTTIDLLGDLPIESLIAIANRGCKKSGHDSGEE